MVRFFLRLPGVRSLHDRQLLFPVVVVVVVVAVLVQGALDHAARAERDLTPNASVVAVEPSPLAQTSRPALRGNLEKTPLTYFADYWAQLATEVGVHLIAVGPSRVGSVAIGPGIAVTTLVAADALDAEVARIRLAHDATEVEDSTQEAVRSVSAVRAVDRGLGLAIVEIEAAVEPFATASTTQVTSGSYVGAVSLSASGLSSIAPGYLVSVETPDATTPDGDLYISVPPPIAGVAAVVDLDGALVGITYHAADGPRALSVAGLRRAIDRMERVEPCRAIVVSELSDDVLSVLSIDAGVVIADVVVDAFVPEPSLRPGDVLLEWAGEQVTSVDRFVELYDAAGVSAVVPYRVIRGRRRVSGGTVLPDAECRANSSAAVRLVGIGMALRWQDRGINANGWLVTIVAPGGRADVAGILEGDVLVAVDGRPVSRIDQQSELDRLDERAEPVLLTLHRDSGIRLVAVTVPEL